MMTIVSMSTCGVTGAPNVMVHPARGARRCERGPPRPGTRCRRNISRALSNCRVRRRRVDCRAPPRDRHGGRLKPTLDDSQGTMRSLKLMTAKSAMSGAPRTAAPTARRRCRHDLDLGPRLDGHPKQLQSEPRHAVDAGVPAGDERHPLALPGEIERQARSVDPTPSSLTAVVLRPEPVRTWST